MFIIFCSMLSLLHFFLLPSYVLQCTYTFYLVCLSANRHVLSLQSRSPPVHSPQLRVRILKYNLSSFHFFPLNPSLDPMTLKIEVKTPGQVKDSQVILGPLTSTIMISDYLLHVQELLRLMALSPLDLFHVALSAWKCPHVPHVGTSLSHRTIYTIPF